MTKENIKKTLSHSREKSVFCKTVRKKICILANSRGKKSVYTDKIRMSGRSEVPGLKSNSSDELSLICHRQMKPLI